VERFKVSSKTDEKNHLLVLYLFLLGMPDEDSLGKLLPGEKRIGNLALFFSQKLDWCLFDHIRNN